MSGTGKPFLVVVLWKEVRLVPGEPTVVTSVAKHNVFILDTLCMKYTIRSSRF